MTVEPFRIAIPQPLLDDLRQRLERTRWPDEAEGAGWEYGAELAFVRELVGYWRDDYDWRAREAELNRLSHYRAEIDGLGVHFIHERGRGPAPRPLLLLHGWPDSFYRYVKLIPLLTDPARFGGDPADAFDVIIPSLPGFGFSDRPAQRGGADVAGLLIGLMERLGYHRFFIHGGDTGSPLAKAMASRRPDAVAGIHLSDIGYDAAVFLDPAELTPPEQEYLARVEQWSHQHGGYYMIQSTRPQTLAYGLTDSPAGLAAWIVDHFHQWRDPAGDAEGWISRDDLLTNVMIYWATGTLNSSIRWYRDANDGAAWEEVPAPVSVPVGVALFPYDPPLGGPPPRELAERTLNVRRWTEMA
ncbi:MAG TPA: alpha/beta fold hydrolase, partial [Herpetosiphonaceae bacterium]